MVNTEIRLIIFYTTKDGETLYSQQKQNQELTVTHIMNSLLQNSDLNENRVNTRPFSYVRLWNPMDCSTPGLPVHHQCLGPTQSYVPQVADAIQPSHPLSSPFPPAFNLSLASRSFPKNQFFTSGVQSIGASASASALSVNIQD